MAPTNETHSGVAGVTPHGQLQTLHGAADDGPRAKARATTATPPGSRPVRSVTRGEAESSRRRTDSTESRTRKRQPSPQQPPRRANRVFVLDPEGKPLAPCTPRRARMLIDRKRVARRYTGPSPSNSRAGPTTTLYRTTPRSGPPPAAGPPASPSSSRPTRRIAPSTRRRSGTAPTSPAASWNAGATGAGVGARSGTERPGSTTAGTPPTDYRHRSRASSRTRSTASPDCANGRAPTRPSSRTASSTRRRSSTPPSEARNTSRARST